MAYQHFRRSSLIALVCVAGAAHGQGFPVGCNAPTGLPSSDFLCLDDYDMTTELLWRSIGEVNFQTAVDSNFVPFQTGWSALPGSNHINTAFRAPYGDRLGYEASGLFDVDGDGYNDWATTWYDAEPVRGVSGLARVPTGAPDLPAYILPVASDITLPSPDYAKDAADLASKTSWEKVGMMRVFSGRTNIQIGAEIWGHQDKSIFPHEIAPLSDIDGDGRDEMIISANTTEETRGSVNIMSYTNLYNERDTNGDLVDTTERWVCILRIIGQKNNSQFAYELEDKQSDYNGDGQNDITVSSKFWRTPNDGGADSGAGWIFLTPDESVFTGIQQSTTWDLFDDPVKYGTRDKVKMPIELVAEDDYNMCVMQLNSSGDALGEAPGDEVQKLGPIGDLIDAGDLDGDGYSDFAVAGSYEYDPGTGTIEVGSYYFLLSDDGFAGTGTAAKTLHDKEARYNELDIDGRTLIETTPHDGFAIDVYRDAEIVIHGDELRDFRINRQSQFGINLDGNGSNDMALVTYKTNQSSHGEVTVLLDDGNKRFKDDMAVTNIHDHIPASYSNRPGAIPHDHADLDPDHTFSGNDMYESSGTNTVTLGKISDLRLAGNYDGLGDADCELSITTRKANNPGGSGNINSMYISSVSVVEIPDSSGEPTILRTIQHETPVYNHFASTTFTGSTYGRTGMQRRGLKGDPAWDIDGDGKDDLLLRDASTSGPVLKAPDPAGSSTPIQIFDESLTGSGETYDGYHPYMVDGQGPNGGGTPGRGSTHLLLSPPAEPEYLASHSYSQVALVEVGEDPEYLIVITIDGISSEIGTSTTVDGETFKRDIDFNDFTIEVLEKNTTPANVLQTITQETPTLLEISGKKAPRRFSFRLPASYSSGTISTLGDVELRFETRWTDSSDDYKIFPVPGLQTP